MKQATIGRTDVLDYSGNEAMNAICSNLSFARRDVKKIVFTSCSASEGKTYLTMQIALNLVRRGKRVVFVDADMRRSYVIKRFSVETNGEWRGLAHYLAGYSDIEDVLYATNFSGLCIIPAGRDVANPLPLLDSHYFAELLDMLSERFDYVIVDAPPLGVVIDAAEIAQACDGAVFVVEYNKTRRKDLLAIRKQMEQTECPILGCVVNKVSFDSFSAKRYYNKSYYYGSYSKEYYSRTPQQSESTRKTN